MGVCVCVFVELVCSKANMIYVNTQLSVRRNISSVSLATKARESAGARPGEPSWSESGVSVFVVCL